MTNSSFIIRLKRYKLTFLILFLAAFASFYAFADDTSSANAPSANAEVQTVAVVVATDSENDGYEASKAFDGRKETFWHSQFSQPPFEYSPIPISCGYGCGCNIDHPHRKTSRPYDAARPFELRVDLGDEYELSGFRYFPRNDENKNGQVREYEAFAFAEAPASPKEKLAEEIKASLLAPSFTENGVWSDDYGRPLVSGAFKGDEEEAQNGALIRFSTPIKARYFVFRVKSEQRDKPYAAVAELELLSEGTKFVASNAPGVLPREATGARVVSLEEASDWGAKALAADENRDAIVERLKKSPYFCDLVDQHNRLVYELYRLDYYAAISSQIPTPQAGILPSDRDPADVVFRRAFALWKSLDEANDVELSELDGDDANDEFKLWARLNKALEETPVENTNARFNLYLTLAFYRRALLFKRSELTFDKILFVKRNRSNYNHLCDQFYGRSAVAGGGLFLLENAFLGLNDAAIKSDVASADNSPYINELNALASKIGVSDESTNSNDVDLSIFVDSLYAPSTEDLLENSVVENDSRLKGQALKDGAFIAPELSFDGKKIAFAYCECKGSAQHIETLDLSRGHTQEGRCYHVFTCDADGKNLQMITDGTWNDFDPCFLPNGRMAFITERRNGYLRCGRDCPTYTLFDMNPDGSKIRCLSRHETNEWAPSVANNGQILWTRWDYIDRFGCIAHGAWTTSPEGRNPRQICGNYAPRHLRPDSMMDIRAIPNSTKLIATAGPHHGQSFGSIIEIDPNAQDDPISPYARMTPEIGFPESQDGAQVWGTPWPLAEDLFMAVADYSFDRNSGREGGKYELGNYGIYLVDAFGNRELLYRDEKIGASTPIPFVARETPIELPLATPLDAIQDEPFVAPPDFDAERPQGVVSIQNVYETDRPFPANTKIKSIRVVQVFCMTVPSGRPPYEIGLREATSTDSVKLARRVWGVAPVEEDGSACFYAPANCEIYFQLLDEEGCVVQSMRSGTALQPGENLSCIGCHEERNAAGLSVASVQNVDASASGAQVPLALRREPSKLTSEGVGTQPVNFPELVQPILDERCVECHNEPESAEEGAPNLAKTPTKNGFYASYWNLTAGGYAYADFRDPLRTTPGQYGARASKLYELLKDHHEVELSDSERRRIALWLDTTSNFYGVYEKEGCEKEFRGERAVPTLE